MTEPTNTVVVLTALECEHQAVLERLTDVRMEPHSAGTLFNVGKVAGGEVALALVGPGNIAAAAIAERAINKFEPQALLFVGVAGGLNPDLVLGTVVVATKVYAYHGGSDRSDGFHSRPQAWEADHGLEQIARMISRSDGWATGLPDTPAVHFRPIAAGEVVLNSATSPLREQLRSHYDDAAAIEMESAGSAKASSLNRAPHLTVRGISDLADGQKHTADRSGSQQIASRNAAAMALAVIEMWFDLNPTANAAAPEKTEGRLWETLAAPVTPRWRADVFDLRNTLSKSALEVHLIPIDDRRVSMRQLRDSTAVLLAHGRAQGLFDQTESLDADNNEQVAYAKSTTYESGPRGLAVFRDGQRSAWSPLPGDSMGGILDADHLPRQIADSLRLAFSLPGIPEPERVAIAAGIDPLSGTTVDSLSRVPRNSVSGFKFSSDPLRVNPDEAVSYSTLEARVDEVSREVAAQVVAAFRAVR